MTRHADQAAAGHFRPPRLLRNAHVQTLLASLGRKPDVVRRAAALLAVSRPELITCSDGVILQAWVNEPPATDRRREMPADAGSKTATGTTDFLTQSPVTSGPRYYRVYTQ